MMSSTEVRQSVLSKAGHVVVKLGTQVLTSTDPRRPGLDLPYFKRMAKQVAGLRERGVQVTVVSSGAIGAGCAELGLARRPEDLTGQQAAAAVGQRRLMTHYHKAFEQHDIKVAQLLLTRDDFDDRVRFLNIRNCIGRLQELGCVPIINENDTVAVDELRFGDNDMLAALTCNAVAAEVLVILSGVDGLLDGDGKRVDLVKEISGVAGLVRSDKSVLGTGGMSSKLQAARLVTEAGEVAVIANGRQRDVLTRLMAGEAIGTVFAPAARPRKLDSRERWIGLTSRPAGSITIDDGAAAAIRERHKSLLASGVTHASGHFENGQVVLVRDSKGNEVARGLTNYSGKELERIMGKKSSQFQKILGRPAYAEVIHKDNLVVVSGR